ncbi:low molecular weight phosphatase family protein [Halobacteriales archaeon QH_10_67_22]|nr:MAG: low molecular weight phosphatase family protein [Halobacteriales archaeon QH_10_67_22]
MSEIDVAFVCVQNAGRSQMSTAFAEQERAERGLDDRVTIHTGGTDPADHVHEVVVEAMREEGIDLSGRTPRSVDTETLNACDYVATMGCSTLELEKTGVSDHGEGFLFRGDTKNYARPYERSRRPSSRLVLSRRTPASSRASGAFAVTPPRKSSP